MQFQFFCIYIKYYILLAASIPLMVTVPSMAYLPPSIERIPNVMKQAIEHGLEPSVVDEFINMLKTHFQV